MEGVKVRDSQRKKRRELNDALGTDIMRYLTEVITNADDSYRRMEAKSFIKAKGKINIRLETEKEDKIGGYVITVTDNAEGISEESMKSIFEIYGDDNAGGIESHARGIFGQGASDVLRGAAREKRTANIISIKDNKVCKLTYNMDEDYNFYVKTESLQISKEELSILRQKLGIPKNGTTISFGIPSIVKFTTKMKENFAELISIYPSFRYLLNQENRIITYTNLAGNVEVLKSSKYQFKEENLIIKEKFKFVFENKKMNCSLRLYKNENKNKDNTEILVRDENYSVFDNTMFGLKNFASAANISGELVINGLYNICYEHLNRENADAIVNDNRTGFDTKNPFYEELNKIIVPKIKKVLEEQEKDSETTNLTNNKKYSQALKELNKYFKEELNDEIGGGNRNGKEPPEEGIRFARTHARITKGKKYAVKLYINSRVIPIEEDIIVRMEDNNFIEISPLIINYKSEEVKNDLVIKTVEIKAKEITKEPITITAMANGRKTSITVVVIEDEIHYPEEGIDFYPNDVAIIYNKPHRLNLYIDASLIPINSMINLECKGLELQYEEIKFMEDDLIDDSIGKIEIILYGGEINNLYKVVANAGDYTAEANIKLIEESKNNDIGGGFIAGFYLEKNSLPFQAYYNPFDHYIKINSTNPINILILGDMKDKDPKNPDFSREQNKYLCDIIAQQAAKTLIKLKNIKHGDFDVDIFEDAAEKLLDLIQEQKNIIYQKIYKVFDKQ